MVWVLCAGAGLAIAGGAPVVLTMLLAVATGLAVRAMAPGPLLPAPVRRQRR